MNIHSTTPGGYGPKPRASDAGAPSPTAPVRADGAPEPASDSAPVDRVELSAEARGLSASVERPSAAAGGLQGQRIRELALRMAGSHYNNPDVVSGVLKGVLAELAELSRLMSRK
jgi:hypothetical protein